MARRRKISRRALRLDQNEKRPLFLFSLTGEELNDLADVSRISRGKAGKLLGYQRPAVKRHIGEIAEYLDSDDVIFPNPVILALPPETVFKPSRGPRDGMAQSGTVEIPVPREGEKKACWIVDGQQRALALLRCSRRDMPVPVNGFVADSLSIQRDQFLRINNSKPLPRGLITELLPEVTTPLPAKLAARKIPSALCDLLNQHPDSPFQGLIRRASTPSGLRGRAVVSDSSLVKMIEASISEPSGCLFPYHNVATGETDFESVQALLFAYWTAVKETFPDAWGKPPKSSRLMHGAGIRALGRLMDKVMSHANPRGRRLVPYAKRELAKVSDLCHWTSGRWEEFDLRWNEVQNVPRHVKLLSNTLVRAYVQSGSSV